MGISSQPADPLTADEEADSWMADEEVDSWTADEDRILTEYVQSHVFGTWSRVPEDSGLIKSAKSCFLRWLNHLCPVKTRLPVEEQNLAILLNLTGLLCFDMVCRRFGKDLYDDVAYFWLSYMNNTILPLGIEHKWTRQEAVGETEQYSTELKLSSSGNKRDANCMEINHTNVGPIQSNPIQPTPEYGLHMVKEDVIRTDTSENSYTARNDTHGDYSPNDDQNYNYTSLDTTHIMKMPNCIKDLLVSGDVTGNERDVTTCIIEQNDTNGGHRYTTPVSSMPQADFHIQNNCFVQVDYPGNIDTACYDQCDDEDDDQNNIPGSYITTKICITLEDLKKHFHLNLEDAAKSLNVSRSSLKRICREYGIERWPCRKRKVNHKKSAIPKNASNDRRKRSTKFITPLGNVSRSRNNIIVIKATYGDDIVKFQISVSTGLNELREKIGTRLELELRSFRLKYKDNAGDLVLITCDEDLHYCLGGFSVSKSIDHETTLDISVFPVSNYKG